MHNRIFDEDVYREALTRWEVNTDRRAAERVLAGAGTVMDKLDKARAELKRLRSIEAAAVRAVLAGHYTARQQLITDLYTLSALTPDQTRAALRALDGTRAGQ